MFRTEQFTSALDTSLRETGRQLARSAHEVAIYTAQISAQLTAAVGQKGFEEAVIAARDSVALFAGVSAVNSADAADQRVIGLIHGAIAMTAATVTIKNPPPK